MEHRDQFPGRELGRLSEEAPGEHLQREVPGSAREAQPIEEAGRALAVVGREGGGELDIEQLHRRGDVDRSKITKV